MARGDQRRDPLIALRIPEALDQRLRAHAADTGSTLSEVVRDAIEHRLAPTTYTANPNPPTTTTAVHRNLTTAKCQHRVRVGNYCRRCDSIV